MSGPGWDGETDDLVSDGYQAEAESKRTAHYTVTFAYEYDPEEINPIREWMTADYLTDSLCGDDALHDRVTSVSIEEYVEPTPVASEKLP